MMPFCDRQTIGPLTPGVRAGTTHDARTTTALLLVGTTCAIHTASALCYSLWKSAASWSGDAKGTTPLFLRRGFRMLKGWMLATISSISKIVVRMM